MKKQTAVLSVAAVLALLAGVAARADEVSQIDQALNASMAELSGNQIQMKLNDDSHREFRDVEVEKNERIEVDPNEGGLTFSSAKN